VAKGKVVYVGIPPGWYGGNLDHVIEDPEKGTFDVEMDRIFIEEYQFATKMYSRNQEYGTIDNIVSIYGFIFGKKVIEHIKRENDNRLSAGNIGCIGGSKPGAGQHRIQPSATAPLGVRT
jgi:hypothetical protein